MYDNSLQYRNDIIHTRMNYQLSPLAPQRIKCACRVCWYIGSLLDGPFSSQGESIRLV